MGIRCGVDIIEINRVMDAINRTGQAFIDRIFTLNEAEFCEGKKMARFQSYAARFAGKEAVSKALGTGFSKGVSFKNIEILCDDLGNPNVKLTGNAERVYAEIGGISMDISLSHCQEYAVAYVVVQTKEE